MRRRGRTAAAALFAGASALAASSAASALAAQKGMSPPAEDASATLVARADAHYARRDSSRTGVRASAAEIAEAVSLYERAAREPGNAEARWKLALSLYFLGTYTGLDEAGQRAVFARARQAGEEALAIVAGRKKSGAGSSIGESSPRRRPRSSSAAIRIPRRRCSGPPSPGGSGRSRPGSSTRRAKARRAGSGTTASP